MRKEGLRLEALCSSGSRDNDEQTLSRAVCGGGGGDW